MKKDYNKSTSLSRGKSWRKESNPEAFAPLKLKMDCGQKKECQKRKRVALPFSHDWKIDRSQEVMQPKDMHLKIIVPF